MIAKREKPEPLRLTREQCRAVDRYAIDTLCIPSVVLMENAGRNVADHIVLQLRKISLRKIPRIGVVCGKGNNGGDGFVIARHLLRYHCEVSVDLATDAASLSGDAALNYAVIANMGMQVDKLTDMKALKTAAARWRKCDVIVDALLGTGFTGAVRDPLTAIITSINAIEKPIVIAVDVPSGLDADTGKPGGIAIRADQTVTFLAEKVGYSQPSAKTYLGRVIVADIGVPVEWILDRMSAATPNA